MKVEWNNCETLGARHKGFQWTYDENKALTIKSIFKNGTNKTTFTNK